MEITVNDGGKTVEIWLTNAEKVDEGVNKSLKPLYKEYHDRKFTVGVFLSGGGDLFEGTRDLLIHNKRVSAEKNVDNNQ